VDLAAVKDHVDTFTRNNCAETLGDACKFDGRDRWRFTATGPDRISQLTYRSSSRVGLSRNASQDTHELTIGLYGYESGIQ
jgi:hypothetical protein